MVSSKERIFKLRQRFKLTRAELAEKINVNYRTIYYWEKGIRKPSFKHTFALISLAKSFGINDITIDWLRPDL